MERGAQQEGSLRRPLVLAFAACVAGDGLARVTGCPGAVVLVAGLAAGVAVLRAALARGGARAGPGRGPQVGLWIALAALAALRVLVAEPAAEAPLVGRWRALRGDGGGRGELEERAGVFEVAEGLVRDGEWVELLPTRPATPAARGPVAPAGGAGASLPVELVPDELRRLRPARPDLFERLAEGLGGWREAGLERSSGLRSPPTRGLARALLFGERDGLGPELLDLFTRTGTRHLLAVSGLHVALVASLWIWPLGSLLAWLARACGARGRRLGSLGRAAPWRVLLLALVAPLAGAGAPVVRASLALALAQVAELLPARGRLEIPRRADALSLWALAGLLEWLVEPRALTSLSLQLSYLATLGLILLAAPILRGLRRALPGGGRVAEVGLSGRPRPPLARLLLQRGLDFVLAGVAASVAANLATLPLSWWVFGEWSLAGPVATLLVLPLVALFLGLAWAWTILPLDWLETALDGLTRAALGLLQGLDRLPGTPVPLPERPLPWLLLAGGAGLLAARGGRLGRRLARTSAALWGLALLPWGRAPRGLELELCDVGHGTAAVVRAPGAPTLVFDGGSRDRPRVGRAALGPLLRRLDPGTVAVALSHGEADHARALPWLAERWRPALWLGALPARIEARLPHDCPRLDLPRGRLEGALGPAGSPEDELRWSLLRGLEGDGNEGSRSLELRWRGRRLLLCGDAEGDGLAAQLRSGAIQGPYDLVLFPHHGSETPWLTPFLEAARPREVWLSCSGEPPVAAELDRRGIPWRSTARDGPLRARW